MYLKSLLVTAGLFAALQAHADNALTPQPLAPSAQAKDASSAKATPRRMPAPTIHVTRVTRQPDGTLGIDCVQRPNPKLLTPVTPASPKSNGGQP